MSSSILTSQGPVPIDDEIQEQVNGAIAKMASNALRLIAVAYCDQLHELSF